MSGLRQVGPGGRLEPLHIPPGKMLLVPCVMVEEIGDNCVIGLMAGGQTVQVPLPDLEERFADLQTVRDALAIESKRKRVAA